MPEVSIKDQLKKLVELQKVDKEIYEIKSDLEEKPAIIAQLKDQFEESKARLNALEEKVKNIELQRKEIELEMKSKEDEISKANAQLSQIKTNREYTAKVTEIESLKADKSICEEKILNSYDEVDAANAEVDKEKAIVAEYEKEFQTKKKVIEDEVKTMQDKVAALNGERKQLVENVDKTILPRYERIVENKQGIAIVPVAGNSCGGCYMNVTPQMVNAIKIGVDFVSCEQCARILYLEDEIE